MILTCMGGEFVVAPVESMVSGNRSVAATSTDTSSSRGSLDAQM